jgi:hypothetical protein
MPLKPEQRAEPVAFGPELIRQKLLEAGASRGAAEQDASALRRETRTSKQNRPRVPCKTPNCAAHHSSLVNLAYK